MSRSAKTEAMEANTAAKGVRRDALGRVTPGSGAINAGGLTREAREKRDLMRQLLLGDAEEVHAALMRGIKADNPLLVKYAHEQLYGKAPDKLDVKGSLKHDNPFSELSADELRALVKRG